MKKLQILGAALFAVLAVGAIIAGSASAVEWLKNGAKITAKEAATSDGKLILVHEGGIGGKTKILCEGSFKGTVGPGAEDEVTLVEKGTEQDLVICKVTEGTVLTCGVGSNVTVHAEKLSWATKLLFEGGKTLDDFAATGAYDVLCGTTLAVLCEGAVKNEWKANGANGAEFLWLGKAGGETTCSDGGKGFIEDDAGANGTVLGFTVAGQ